MLLLGSAAASAVATGLATRYLRQRAILDHPNERSSHAVPTPRGGGWGILAVLVPAWTALGVGPGVLAGVVLLAAVSWIDDRRSLPAGPRLLVQAAAIAAGLMTLGDGMPGLQGWGLQGWVFQGWLPAWADRGLTGLCWLWFTNLFNFMDGIDGIAGSEAVSVAGGLALAAGLAGTATALIEPSLAVAGAAAGFLVWNWQPAKVFMGDVGSIPLGYGLGWLLFSAAGAGLWQAALLLPLVFVADASFTLARRALAGKRILQAHREHAYQRAVQGGWSHGRVVRAVLAVNAGLAGLALAAPQLGWPLGWAALAAGAAAVFVLLWCLHNAVKRPLK